MSEKLPGDVSAGVQGPHCFPTSHTHLEFDKQMGSWLSLEVLVDESMTGGELISSSSQGRAQSLLQRIKSKNGHF